MGSQLELELQSWSRSRSITFFHGSDSTTLPVGTDCTGSRMSDVGCPANLKAGYLPKFLFSSQKNSVQKKHQTRGRQLAFQRFLIQQTMRLNNQNSTKSVPVRCIIFFIVNYNYHKVFNVFVAVPVVGKCSIFRFKEVWWSLKFREGWSSGQNSCLQIARPGFASRRAGPPHSVVRGSAYHTVILYK